MNLNQEKDSKSSAVFAVRRQSFFVVLSGSTKNDAIPSPRVMSGCQVILNVVKIIINVLLMLQIIIRHNSDEKFDIGQYRDGFINIGCKRNELFNIKYGLAVD